MPHSSATAEPPAARTMARVPRRVKARRPSAKARKAERLDFLKAFLRKPITVGAPCPSSPALAQAMLQDCDLRNAHTVVEFGPGTGAFTRLILDRIGRRTLFFALELDATCVERLRRELDGIEVHHDSAENVGRYLEQHRRSRADYIISGLPWSNMGGQVQDRILEAVVTSLAPRGVFSTFAYVHSAWFPTALRFRKRLKHHFGSVGISRIVWRNLPPAYVYRCRLRG